MKILDRYILTSYLKTFISVFVILMLIFVLQTIWLYIKELAGKDLDIFIIGKFLLYFMPKLIPLVLPLTILLASIMVFGNFAENYEFAAMKSTGISLQRAMSGLSIFIVFLGFTTFMFSNNVIPWAEYNSFNLRKNIAKLKPAMLLAEGQFNPIENYNIKFSDKSGDNDQYLKDVIIHIKGADGRTNTTTFISKTGELVGNENDNVLKLILLDGYQYNDIIPKGTDERKKYPFAKSKFEKHIINIDLSKLNDVDIDDKSLTDKYNMLDLSGLDKAMDSLIEKRQTDHEVFAKNIYDLSNIDKLDEVLESTKPVRTLNKTEKKNDSIFSGEVLDIFTNNYKPQVIKATLSSIENNSKIIISKEANFKNAKVLFNRHIISFHEKLALGFACIILFFVGAPLGALIRKGGIGLPMVIAILLFLTYHFIGIFATNSAKNGGFNPILASWFSTLLMFPLGIFLTKRATADKGLFEFGNITEPLKNFFNIKDEERTDYTFLSKYKNEELIDVINNFKILGHEENSRYEALTLLNTRGITTNELIKKDLIVIDDKYTKSQAISMNYKQHAKFAITLYTIGIILLVLFFVFKNNKLPSLASASIQLSLVSLFLYIIYYVKSIINLTSFYNHINRKRTSIILLIIGLPLYMIMFPFLRLILKEDLIQNCLDSLK